MEKIINKRLVWFLEKGKLIETHQNGFRKHRSTNDSIINLESEIHESFANNKHLLCVFIDLKKAYDMAWRYNITQTLSSWGFRGNILSFVGNFLDNRIIRVKANNQMSEEREIFNGIPQGSVLSVTLFLIAINNILKDVKKPVKGTLFADDVMLYVQGKNTTSMGNFMQTAIKSLENWSKQTGFLLSSEKTSCVCFSKKSPTLPVLKLNNQILEYRNSVKFLGIIFDRKLTWRPHIDYLRQTCFKTLNLLKTLSHHKWGADTNVLLRIYRTLIRSKLDYGSVAYSTCSKFYLKRLDTIQNSALRIALGAFCTSPVESLHCLACEPPLHFRRTYLSLSYATGVAFNNANPAYKSIFSRRFQNIYNNKPHITPPFHERLNRIFDSYLDTSFPTLFINKPEDGPPPWLTKPLKINTMLSSFCKRESPSGLIKSEFTRLCNKYKDSVFLYTDASKSPEGVGAAVVDPLQTSMYSLPSHSSVFTGELFALLQATLKVDDYPGNQYVVCSDSLSALDAIRQLYPTNPLTQLLRKQCHTLSEANKAVTFLYVPSHIGIVGNEAADNAAKQAVSSDGSQKISRSLHWDVKNYFRSLVMQVWQDSWNASSSKLLSIKSSVTAPLSLPSNRRSQILLSRLRIGHTRLTHQHLLTRSEAPVCDSCNCQVTVQHVLVECVKFNENRVQCNLVPDMKKIIGNTSTVPIASLVNYLKLSELYHLL